MAEYIGDFRSGKTVRWPFPSNAIAGESITLAVNGTVQVYKDGNTAQSTAGVSFVEDFDGLVGVHYVVITMSSDVTFYSVGSDFVCCLVAATIDNKTINVPLFGWSVENRSPLMPTIEGRYLDVTEAGNTGIDWNNIENQSATATLSGTSSKLRPDGLDAVILESGIVASPDLTDDAGTQLTAINGRQGLALAISILAGVLQGAEGLTITLKPAGKPSGNTRATVSVDTDQNRDALVLKVPT